MDGPTESSSILLDEIALCAKASGLEDGRVRELAAHARRHGRPLVEALVQHGPVDEARLLEALAGLLDLPFRGRVEPVDQEVRQAVSPVLAMSRHVMPLGVEGDRLQVACADPFDLQLWDELSMLLQRPLDRVLCPSGVIDRMLRDSYGLGADKVQHLVDNEAPVVATAASTDLSEAEAANEPTVVNLVNQVLSEAIRSEATDIHLEPGEAAYRVRYRIDGMLEEQKVPATVHQLKRALVSRIKIMSSLDITEKRLPQDGRCQVKLAGQDYDLRISILPGVYGEAVVIRLQRRRMIMLDLDALGFDADECERIATMIMRPHGLVLVTGPTGSGKTTTLYTCLGRINRPDTKVVTIEDPVEYWMQDILQMQVHEEIGFTFARALRSMLRHDPDVLLVGEIRDRETADIAVRAALTGHRVFATLHTNDAATGVTRLLDIGIEPFLLASCLNGIIAQRLMRTTCPACRHDVRAEPEQRRLLAQAGLDVDAIPTGQGCEQCRFTRYRGRSAVAELMMIDATLRQLIQQRVPAEQIKETACRQGMRSLRDSSLRAVAAGRTDVEEVIRVTQED
ncbi:MAG: type II secretion system protein GspE [Phycisphaeraceae bacterium]|nr:type II secretion system protein GspE [Phycisphaeraceae bacterium]